MTASKPLWKELKHRASASDLLRLFRVASPPVQVRDIAAGLGVLVQEVVNPGWSGAVSADDRAAVIWVRAGDSTARQRFTIAHELGHLLLHDVSVAFRRDDTFRGSPEEVQANAFAADLLMPLWLLDPVAQSVGQDSVVLARMFEVSEKAMKIRLGRLVGA